MAQPTPNTAPLQVVSFRHRARQRGPAPEWGLHPLSLEDPEEGCGNRDGRGHEPKNVEFVEAQHRVDGVVLVKVGGSPDSTEHDAERQAEKVELHSWPPVTTRKTKVVAIAVAMKVVTAARGRSLGRAASRGGGTATATATPWPSGRPTEHHRHDRLHRQRRAAVVARTVLIRAQHLGHEDTPG